MYCKNCGAKIAENDKFCRNCGAPAKYALGRVESEKEKAFWKPAGSQDAQQQENNGSTLVYPRGEVFTVQLLRAQLWKSSSLPGEWPS